MSDYEHIKLVGTETAYPYTAHQRGGGEFSRPPRDRVQHADRLRSELEATSTQAEQVGLLATDGMALTFVLRPEAMDVVNSLEQTRSGIVLLNVLVHPNSIRATVKVPPGKRRVLEGILDRYKTEETKFGRPKHQDLVESIDAVRLASETDLWTDTLPFPDPAEDLWWEIWLHTDTGGPQAARTEFADEAQRSGFVVKPRALEFPDRIVVLAWGNFGHWAQQPRLLLRVAELRRAKAVNSGYIEAGPRFQRELVDELLGRVVPPGADAPAVCLLDTGVAREHPLLRDALAAKDTETLDPNWGSHDRDPNRHGTTTAGVALYGSLVDAFESSDPVELTHRLESVKILPHSGENEPDTYGNMTQEAMARIESLQPERQRVFSLTVTADCRDGGFPSAWSGALDQVCMGGEDTGSAKLICVSAGNLRDQIFSADFDYPMIDDPACGVEDPGQAWNALTVGAMTDRIDVGEDPAFVEYRPLATAGDLSPTSRVSLAWPDQGWPLKPDIVMEGGNWAYGPSGDRCVPDDLGLLTTTLSPEGRLLTITHDTSPATAAAARLGARIFARYPNLRPETVRGLLVHAARWTTAMHERFPGSNKAAAQSRLRCYGYGVPDERRALYSAENTATMVYEGDISPYRTTPKGEIKTNMMHVHELPWPSKALENLGAVPVRLRVTLSYFIEPSPGRRGWKKRHRYASHGLRFEVFRPTESEQQFLARINAAMLNEDSGAVDASQTLPWVVGPQGRTKGSVHCDWCETTAADLLLCGKIAVFPVTGWWKERKHLGRWDQRAPYSLIVSLETGAEDVDLYTEIKTKIAQTIAVDIAPG